MVFDDEAIETLNVYHQRNNKNKGSKKSLATIQIKNIARDFLKGMKNAPTVKVVGSTKELPFNAPENVQGAFRPIERVVWLVADQMPTPENARETLFHEIIGHYGLRGFFGDQASLNNILLGIHNKNSNIREAAKKWIKDNKDIIPAYRKMGYTLSDIHALSIEEAMAKMPEKGQKITGLKQLALWLQKALRKIGLNDLANKLEAKTDAEALDLYFTRLGYEL